MSFKKQNINKFYVTGRELLVKKKRMRKKLEPQDKWSIRKKIKDV